MFDPRVRRVVLAIPRRRPILTRISIPLPSDVNTGATGETVIDGFGSLNAALETIYTNHEVRS